MILVIIWAPRVPRKTLSAKPAVFQDLATEGAKDVELLGLNATGN